MSEWKDTGNVKKSLIERNSSDCTTPKPEPQWSRTTTCIGFDKYVLWVSTNGEERLGELIEKNSSDCGYSPSSKTKYRWIEYDTFCDGNDLRAKEKKQKCTISSSCDCGNESNCWEDVLDENGNLVTRNGRIVEKDGCYTPDAKTKYRWVNCGTICDNCNSYEKLKQQKCIVSNDCDCLGTDPIDSPCWIDTGKTKRGNLIKENDENCEGCAPSGTKHRWVSADTECIGCDLWLVEKKQECSISNDCSCLTEDHIDSSCWEDMLNEEGELITRTIRMLKENSQDCHCEPEEYERWREDGVICDGCEKYVKMKKQKSEDGINWYDVVPEVTKKGELIGVDKIYCDCICSFVLNTDASTVTFYYRNGETDIEVLTVDVSNGKAILPKNDLYNFMVSQGLEDLNILYAEPKRKKYIYNPEKVKVECNAEAYAYASSVDVSGEIYITVVTPGVRVFMNHITCEIKLEPKAAGGNTYSLSNGDQQFINEPCETNVWLNSTTQCITVVEGTLIDGSLSDYNLVANFNTCTLKRQSQTSPSDCETPDPHVDHSNSMMTINGKTAKSSKSSGTPIFKIDLKGVYYIDRINILLQSF